MKLDKSKEQQQVCTDVNDKQLHCQQDTIFLCLRVMVTHEPSQVKLMCPQKYLDYTLHMPLQCS